VVDRRGLTMVEIRGLLARGCQDPDCTNKECMHWGQLVLAARCHPGRGVTATARIDGVVSLVCAVCARPVCNLVIAEGPDVVQ